MFALYNVTNRGKITNYILLNSCFFNLNADFN